MFSVTVEEPSGEYRSGDGRPVNVYDVVCHKAGSPNLQMYVVNLERHGRYDRRKVVKRLTIVMRSHDNSWWTLTGDRYTGVRGFKTRRHAIEHELRRQKYWKDL